MSLFTADKEQGVEVESKPACGRCKFWQEHLTYGHGECRRYPPTVVSGNTYSPLDEQPRTKPEDWCGEFQQVIEEE